ncbi:MAG: hypothetical protein HQ556_07065 [Candidatus Marinimicrobia bacterium]|nr:hypothetical protein [Candidatus Neomarinimicrobiota bacterium]
MKIPDTPRFSTWALLLPAVLIFVIFSCDLFNTEEEVAEDPYFSIEDEFTFYLTTTSPIRPEIHWPTYALWIYSDSIFSTMSTMIGLTTSYPGSNISISIDSFIQPQGFSLPAFGPALGLENIEFSEGTHRLIFLNGNVENIFEYSAQDSSIEFTPIVSSFIALRTE